MTATVESVRAFGLGFPQPDDDLTLACVECWPDSGFDPSWFRATWKHTERGLAEQAAADHNATYHPRSAVA
ncbi:hypothetical protein ACLQ3K_25865 [Tsukamurella sp. DT100]|uniref:hypothetical protein n=1 Tax=Tsukamurella sp. DT100 TaxID=3393415 RepID=UPI003CEC3F34